MRRVFIFFICLFSLSNFAWAAGKKDASELTMVFVPASEKAQSNEFESLLKIVEKLTEFTITSIDVLDYNAAVEAMCAGRADMAWFGAQTYVKAVEMAGAEPLPIEMQSSS